MPVASPREARCPRHTLVDETPGEYPETTQVDALEHNARPDGGSIPLSAARTSEGGKVDQLPLRHKRDPRAVHCPAESRSTDADAAADSPGGSQPVLTNVADTHRCHI